MVVQDAVRGEYLEETKLLLDRGGKIHEGGKVGRLPSESAKPIMLFQQAFLPLPAQIRQIHPWLSVFLLHLLDVFTASQIHAARLGCTKTATQHVHTSHYAYNRC